MVAIRIRTSKATELLHNIGTLSTEPVGKAKLGDLRKFVEACFAARFAF
jgi:hypothetical protein